ncbi:BRO family protein [Acinetobacter venetianus]
MNSLTFNTVTLHPIQQNDEQVWITSTELARTLGYKQENAVSKIFNRKADEFTSKMTQVIENPQLPNLGMRIFSLRRCHLIAMFARTPVAKEFRKWVLDILDREVQPKTKNHKTERVVLNDAVNMLVAKTKHLNFSDAYKLVHQRFNVKSIDEISLDQIPLAVEYVHHLIALFSADNQPNAMNVRAMAMHLVWLSGWWRQFGTAVRGINPHMSSAIHDNFNDGGFVAWTFIEKEKQAELRKRIETYPWHLAAMDRYHLLNNQN